MSFCWFVHFRPFTYLQCFLSARCGAARLNRCLCFVFVFGGPIKSKPQRDDHTIHNDNREAAVVGRVVPTPKASSVLFRCDPTATRKMARPSVRSRRKNYEQTMWQPTPLTAAAVASFARLCSGIPLRRFLHLHYFRFARQLRNWHVLNAHWLNWWRSVNIFIVAWEIN